MEIRKVGIVGFGTMGSGIAQTCAQAGYQVVVLAKRDEAVSRGLASIDSILSRRVERAKLSPPEKDSIMAHIEGSTSIGDLSDCDLVVEAVNEDLELKKAVFAQLDGVCHSHTIVTSNTSCLSITDLAMATKRPEKVVGTHFHNPAPVMKMLELVKTLVTTDETVEEVKAFGESLGKTVVVLPDTPGFIVNRLAVGFILNAITLLENGIATKEDIDTATKLGLNHPMGPLELADLIGNDIVLDMADGIYETLKEPRYIAPNLLRRMVAAGWLGQKTKKGFYDYNK